MRKKLLFVVFSFVFAFSLAVGLAACSSEKENGKSVYDLYRESYIRENESDDGVLSESE